MSLDRFSDEELQAALRRKKQPALDTFSDEELQAALSKKRAAEPSIADRMWNALHPDVTEALPDLYGDEFAQQAKALRDAQGRSDFAGSAKLSGAAAFGDDADVSAAVLREFPDAVQEQDEQGNPIIRMADGKRYYVNQPGLDASDVGRFAAKTLSFFPAAKLAGKAPSLVLRAVAGAGGAGATDVGMQVGAGRSEIDPSQTLATAAFGGAGEVMAPAVGALYRGARNALRGKTGNVAAGQAIARKAGITGLSDDAAQYLASRAGQIEAGANPAAILAEKEFGYRLTRGQLTGNESLLRREELLRSRNPEGAIGQLEKHNIAQTAKNVEGMRAMAARGQVPEAFEQDAAQRMRDTLAQQQQAQREQMRAAYSAVPSKNAYATAQDAAALPGRISKAMRQSDVILTDQLTPNTIAARGLISQAMEDAGPAAIRMDRLIELRKALGRMRGGAVKEDSRAFSVLSKEFDSWFDESLTRNLIEGGEGAVESFKQANKVASNYFARFEDSKSESGKAIMRMLVEDSTPEQVANVLLNANGINKPGAAAIAKRYIEIVGKSSDGATAIREIVARRLFEKAGDPKGHQALVTSLKDALAGRGRSLMQTVYTRSELAQMKRFADTLDTYFVPKGMLGRSSGTAERLAAFLGPIGQIPGLTTAKNVRNAMADRAATLPLLQNRPSAAAAMVPAAGLSTKDDEKRRRYSSGGQ